MANYTGADVITAADVTKYQPDAFSFGIASTDTEAVNFFAQTTKVNLDQFERAGVYLFIGKFLAPALSKFRPEADKDRFERMSEYYMSEYNKEWQSILEDGVEYDTDADGTIVSNEREPLHGFRRLSR